MQVVMPALPFLRCSRAVPARRCFAVDAAAVVNGVGTLYSNAWQCFAKTVAAEGPAALYKGCTAHFLRAGPHTVLTLLLLDRMQRVLGLSPQQAQQAQRAQQQQKQQQASSKR